ncbi:MAG: UDP-N-acetylmuramoyl-L-alanyl-D-glutamate synthetase [Microgenomates group bacterium GW2011_GWC1_41_20]|uniref:UDP-N-acetylmuramoylalanine--D-glutamate ligase n=1 Tax=Candidatus Woesebacteria bacterium RIFOXYD1_FULL_41_28 TaxID=1802550 RepID=A0A1F8DJ91_9BACT|nr:MAG: UDP-N-acetylmuramoyl-L-alanyl-D-glutamate synthetase [Microgenomates group bacterium GW2011_GWC1_41_20]OGM88674.1 MAG: UDP-N-acetylmuramoylalanine--D-glutamate ligase [Candidatus Woesebacteria bacterium RIFOXYD1_FULL_41_28]
MNNKSLVDFKGKKVAVIGLGIEGRDAINFLLEKGADVTLFDKNEVSDLNFDGIDKDRIGIVAGENYLKDGLSGFEFVVRSPGVYRFIPEIVEAESRGVEITSAIKIFFEECPAKIIGVTGTKGKGTTSTLIYEILKSAGKDVYLSGNIGKPYLGLLPALKEDSWVVLEMSSFQLMDMKVSPHISVVLNITEDHLDWHKDRNEYVSAKANIVKYQSQSDFAVVNEEYETSRNFANLTKAMSTLFSKNKLEAKFKEGLLLRGEHNLENIAAAVTVGKCIGVSEETILETVRNFKGLEHRLELVAEVDGKTFYNDSFATGPQPTIAAVNSFTEPETLILGGSDKGLDYKELGNAIAAKGNVKSVIVIGDTRKKISEALDGEGAGINILDLEYSPMDEIVKKAFEITPDGGVIVLSPGAASFDMFENYKDRGVQFKNSVAKLKSQLL